MKIKTLTLSALFATAITLTSCEQEQLQSPSQTQEVDTEAIKKIIKKNKNGLLTEAELEDYIEEMAEETAIIVNEVNPNQYSVTATPFNAGNINNPPNPNSIWPNNKQYYSAIMAEIKELKDSGCDVDVNCAYGWIAVNVGPGGCS